MSIGHSKRVDFLVLPVHILIWEEPFFFKTRLAPLKRWLSNVDAKFAEYVLEKSFSYIYVCMYIDPHMYNTYIRKYGHIQTSANILVINRRIM